MARDLSFYDSAFPLPNPPHGFDGCAFYIGGDTPHVWTTEQINAQPVRFRLPIYVRSDPTLASAFSDADDAIMALHRIGAPVRTLIALDTEVAADPAYVTRFYNTIRQAGYVLIDYGSVSAVFANDIPDGYYWAAHWTSIRHMEPRSQMTQWAALGAYDESTALPILPFWDVLIPPKPPVAAPVIPGTIKPVQVSVTLPEVHEGMAGEVVRTVQVLCGLRGYFPLNSGTPGSPDGIFGPDTDLAVKTVQSGARITVDGIVGPQTWPVLIGQ